MANDEYVTWSYNWHSLYPQTHCFLAKARPYTGVDISNITRRKISSENYDFEKLLILCF